MEQKEKVFRRQPFFQKIIKNGRKIFGYLKELGYIDRKIYLCYPLLKNSNIKWGSAIQNKNEFYSDGG